ncbi:hypothetical protein [Georgenia sp. AZ-5]|uniref:hypothetical protein n=1 Tax=Georgenia sp. AZ-5 TaxID=3367526 RepID=UPI0037549838
MSRTPHRPLATALATAAATALVGCSQGGTDPDQDTDAGAEREETSAPEAEPEDDNGRYDGPYDSEFYDALGAYEGEEVTVIGEVAEVVSPTSFTIAGTEDTDVGPLLIVSLEATGGLEQDMVVSVTGTVHDAFDITAVEERFKTDLDDDLHQAWSGGPYIEAIVIDLSPTSDH